MARKCKYDWIAIQKYYDDGHSTRECAAHFGFKIGEIIKKAVKAGRFKLRNFSESRQLYVKQGKVNQNWTDASRQILRDNAIKRGLGGHRNSHRIEYNGIMLDSSYELRVAKVLDQHSIVWTRPKTKFVWTDLDGKSHKYSPDFFLPKSGLYLDPKHKFLCSYHKDKIQRVIDQNAVKVLIVPIEMIEDWEVGQCLSILGI